MKDTNNTDKSWGEIDALRARLNQETITKRQNSVPHATNEDKFVARMFGGRVAALVDAKGNPIF